MANALLPLLLGIMLIVVASACSDDGGADDALTIEEYILGFEALRTEPDREPSMFEEFDVRPGTPITENEAYMGAVATAAAEGIARLERLDPPSRLKEAHKTLLAEAEEQAEFFTEPHPTFQNESILRSIDAMCEIYAVADEEGIEHDFSTSTRCDPDDPSKARRRTPTP